MEYEKYRVTIIYQKTPKQQQQQNNQMPLKIKGSLIVAVLIHNLLWAVNSRCHGLLLAHQIIRDLMNCFSNMMNDD